MQELQVGHSDNCWDDKRVCGGGDIVLWNKETRRRIPQEWYANDNGWLLGEIFETPKFAVITRNKRT